MVRFIYSYFIFIAICLLGGINSSFAQTAIYRSVGNTGAALATGAGNALTIAGGVATFATALPTNVGVGDVIQYDSDNNGTIDAYAIIHSRISSQVYTVKIADGLTNPTAEVGDTDWSIFRAYTSINSIDSGTENPSLNVAISNFDTWATGRNLVVNNELWHIACYADATVTTSQVFGRFGGWVTSATRYVHLYVPYLTSQVGVTQRHSGVWDATKFNINQTGAVGGTDDAAFEILNIQNIWIEGIQVFRNENTLTGDVVFFENTNALAGVTLNFNNNILKAKLGGVSAIDGFFLETNEGATMNVWNNIVYDIPQKGIIENSYKLGGITGTTQIFNNTVVNADVGFQTVGVANDGRNVILKNNIVQGSTTWGYDGSNAAPFFGGNFSAASSNNITNHGADTSFGTGFVVSAAVAFVNAGANDYRLSPSDVVAKNAGSSQAVLFTDDIEGNTRGDGSWDIGADEADPNPKAPTVVSVF